MQVLALKYRPKHFSELVGQESVAKTLSLALDNQRLANAYLFSGLRGSGKTSSSRIFARALMCEEGPKAVPCDTCIQCQSALNNHHIDIIEMDGASNRGIDDVRNLIEQTRYKPSFGRYKIFIIDEVHMFTTEAFNALLKTLEEPPSHVKFLLATTDALKLPATILSRTQHFRFKKIPENSVISHLKTILEKEQVSYETSALEKLAHSGQGSLRDTITLLEQAINYCDNAITESKVAEMLGAIDRSVLEDFFQSLINQDEARLKERYAILENYETESVLEEMMLFLKAKLLSPDFYSILLIERFFKIIMSSLSLLKEGANASFVLLLLKMKFKEALKFKALDDAILELEQTPFNQNPSISYNAPKQESKNIEKREKIEQIERIEGTEKREKLEKKENAETPQTPMLSAKDRIFHNLFKQVQTLVYERNYELGAVFEKNIRFIDFDSQTKTLTWESLATDKDKELLRERFKIVKSIVDGVFGKGESIKIALKNHSENKSTLEVVKELKFPYSKPKPTTETTAETKEKETKEKEIQENDTKEIQEVQPKQAPTALQEFMANHSELIEEIKSEFEIKSVELL
ncbi:DNA polymerase III subunit gamma/tau [Helicobacter pylori]|jgi:DNA polymerase III, tau subunit (EC 2.7.7.7)|uniref:DNA polymerase III subunit gamma/tau n=2 Tax=Helicobacter pylori TaxID=210 RepID=O25419_HELPY|nr:DNA polymerase III subunit gamma/tau [Helicobacter pylori]AAD07767.1 DNA polymerase III gamma and tau subunits (dnaX) [Helicobacter pylori 26695]AFV41931.1 DNA polymerase III subunits gamma and tau [Helicobacter pylori 26695]AFV43524.1 DNA polymerase III subunits gamma and tau [Helicobacter pylori Rif1]AFV45118.1 DNA polymerase III subunits gamma and tau [Helicobacter pylori Rif2]AJF08988.1 DNA polymerase III subunits gamma and tau [Helicobacter pylori 26695-1]